MGKETHKSPKSKASATASTPKRNSKNKNPVKIKLNNKKRIKTAINKPNKHLDTSSSSQKSNSKPQLKQLEFQLNQSICDNCNVEFSQEHRPTRKFRVDFDSEPQNNHDLSVSQKSKQMFIGEALNFIFSWKFSLESEITNSKLLLLPFQNEEIQNIRVCGNCGLIIAKLYRSLQLFRQIWIDIEQSSRVCRLIKDFTNSKAKIDEAEVEVPSFNPKIVKPEPEISSHKILRDSKDLGDEIGAAGAGLRSFTVPTDLPFDYTKLLEDDDDEAEGLELEEQETQESVTLAAINPNRKRFRFDPQKQYLCQHCGAGFDKQYALKRHLQLSHDEKERSHPCPHCPKSFHYSYALNEHIKCHSTERNFICDLCGMAFKGRTSVYHHKMDVHKGDSFNCQFCHKTFRQFRSLSEHVTMIHGKKSKAKDFPCSFSCGSSFKRKKSMLLHLRSSCKMNPESPKFDPEFQPPKEAIWNCPLNCGGTYRYIASLKEHIKQRCPNRKIKKIQKRKQNTLVEEKAPEQNPRTMPKFLGSPEHTNVILPELKLDCDTKNQIASEHPATSILDNDNVQNEIPINFANVDILEVQDSIPLNSKSEPQEYQAQIVYHHSDSETDQDSISIPILQLVRSDDHEHGAEEYEELTVTVVTTPMHSHTQNSQDFEQ